MSLALETLKAELSTHQYSLLDIGGQPGFVFSDDKVSFKSQPVALFGGWKWEGLQKNTAFIQAAEKWAREKKISWLIGPYDYSTYFNYRLKTDHFDRPVFAGEPHNQEAEVQFLKNNGFISVQEYETYHFTDYDLLLSLAQENLPKIQIRLMETGLHFSTTSYSEIMDQLKSFYHLSHEIFQDNFLYRPIPYSAFSKYFQYGLAPQICWTSTTLVKQKESGSIVGFSLNFREPHKPEQLLIKSAGVHPDYRHLGLTFIGMSLYSIDRAQGISRSASFCLMKSGNYPSLLSAKLSPTKQSYALFGKNLI